MFQLIDPMQSYALGNEIEYAHDLDRVQHKWLPIQPLASASPANLVIESKEPIPFRLRFSSPALSATMMLPGFATESCAIFSGVTLARTVATIARETGR